MADELIKLVRERQGIEAELTRAWVGERECRRPFRRRCRLREAPLQLEALQETALRERPQLLALRSLVDRSGKTLELARKDYYPDFDVKFAYGQRDKTPDGMRRDDLVSITVAINLPVCGETKRDPRVAEADRNAGPGDGHVPGATE